MLRKKDLADPEFGGRSEKIDLADPQFGGCSEKKNRADPEFGGCSEKKIWLIHNLVGAQKKRSG